MNDRLYVVMGHSGSGKDTIGEYIYTKDEAAIVKFAAPGKRALEFILKIPDGSLDDRVFRMKTAPHCQGRSYLQVLVDFWEHRDKVIGGDLFTAQTFELMNNILSVNCNIVTTDVRNFDEGLALERLAILNKAEMRLIWVSRHGVPPMRSDVNQWAIYSRLKDVAVCYTTINNNGTLEELYSAVDKVVG